MKAVNLEKMLPADLPPGERILWFGRPEPFSLWRRAYRADWIAIWFVAMAAWNVATAASTDGAAAALVAGVQTLGAGSVALMIFGALAYASTRTTLYVITERRVIIKTGVALPMFINVPYKQISSVNARVFGDGTGEVTVGVAAGERVPYLALWPSARPLRFSHPEPSLRCVEDARSIGATLARAVAEAAGEKFEPVAPARAPAPEPGGVAAAAA